MNPILKDRIKLIRAIESAIENLASSEKVSMNTSNWLRDIPMLIRQDYGENFLSFSCEDTRKISYAGTPAHKLDTVHRVKTTLPRFIRRRLGLGADKISDPILAHIASRVFGTIGDHDGDIQIVSGESIVDYYRESFGGSSCMTGENRKNILKLYADNPDKVKLLIYENGIKARCLLWNTDEGETVLDRIYPNDGHHIAAIEQWAQSKGYITRCTHGLPCGDVKLSDGIEHTITLPDPGIYPYLDTFHYGEIDGRDLILSNIAGTYEYIFECTDGNYMGGIRCINCGNSICEDETYHSDGDGPFCESCFGELYAYCDQCETDVPKDSIQRIADSGEYICNNCIQNGDYFECTDCEEFFTTDSIRVAEDTGQCYCEKCSENNLIYCEDCEVYYENEESKEYENRTLCEECYKSAIEDAAQYKLEL